MTGFTYSFKVAYVVSSALRERFYVVDSLGRCISSFGKADLAERMLRGISLSDERPCLGASFLRGLPFRSVFLPLDHADTSRSVLPLPLHALRRIFLQ